MGRLVLSINTIENFILPHRWLLRTPLRPPIPKKTPLIFFKFKSPAIEGRGRWFEFLDPPLYLLQNIHYMAKSWYDLAIMKILHHILCPSHCAPTVLFTVYLLYPRLRHVHWVSMAEYFNHGPLFVIHQAVLPEVKCHFVKVPSNQFAPNDWLQPHSYSVWINHGCFDSPHPNELFLSNLTFRWPRPHTIAGVHPVVNRAWPNPAVVYIDYDVESCLLID